MFQNDNRTIFIYLPCHFREILVGLCHCNHIIRIYSRSMAAFAVENCVQ